jgi:hypothetical protein
MSLGRALCLLFGPEDISTTFLRSVGGTSKRLYGVISQKIVLFVLTAVRTSNLTTLLT